MADLIFTDSHNMVAYLEKSEDNVDFAEIVDFLNASPISAKTTAWNEFSSTMASAIICLATNQRFNFSMYIFDNMVKNLEGEVKFLMYPRFVQVLLDKQVEGMSKHKKIYVTPSHTKKVFATKKRWGKILFGQGHTSIQTMMVFKASRKGEGSVMPTVPQHTPTINRRAIHSHNFQRSKSLGSPRNRTLRIPNLEMVKKLERRNKSRTPWLKRLRKVGRTARIESSKDEGLGDQEDASKQGRKIADIDADEEEVEVEKVVSTAEVTTASATTTTVDEFVYKL
ncbi:hypothetical protein Tco_0830143 [Tanacetum coccineum]